MVPLILLFLLLPVVGYLSSPLLFLLFSRPAPSPVPVDFTLTSSGHLKAHVSLDLIRYLLPTLVQVVALFVLPVLSLYLGNELLNNRISSGRWITRGWLNLGRMSKAEWEKQVILVTGGAGGLGREIVRLALAKGATVVTLDVVDPPAEGPESSGRCFHYQCDVSKSQQVEAISKTIRGDLQKRKKEAGEAGLYLPTEVTVLVNNAGITSLAAPSSYIIALPPSEVSKVLEVNLLSHFHTLRTFLPPMLRRGQGGHVVSVASSMGHVGAIGMADYVSSKFGVIGLHETLCRELKAWRSGNVDEAMMQVVQEAGAGLDDELISKGSDAEDDSSYLPSNVRVQTSLILPSHIATPLFKDWTYPWPFDFLTPTLTPTHVAERIIEEIGERRSGWMYLPRLTWPTAWMGVLPDWMRALMFWMSGSDTAVECMRASARRQDYESEERTPAPSQIRTRAQRAASVGAEKQS
ncbi:NAD(P)-binding protein [Microstroma glucosiphilum]|uniref:NAD(P)-binding protein n=1 Tax=Pseudomicrostroma glucosiphilum TaxID=1684307 RepID=A0A316UBT2_9BASI|nr:NAD(P)-binding protein [Pseudomicrostroma glucosiphilum]PWN20485.1 NAD(P)-binding protein [Pseudomicrostroma glucosiphilum]